MKRNFIARLARPLTPFLAVITLLPLAACGSRGARVITKNDPGYSGYHEGYNPGQGGERPMQCKYRDGTLVTTRSLATKAPTSPMNAALQPGATSKSRGDIATSAQEAAVATLYAGAPSIRQIVSCDLVCEPIPDSPYGGGGMMMMDASAPMPSANGQGGTGGGERAAEASTTNNQVAGVDEADFLKNDNKYMYVIAGSAVKILDAYPAPSARVLSEVPITKGTPTHLLLGQDRLVVYSSVGGFSGSSYGPDAGASRRGSANACTYGFDCEPTGDGSTTHVTVVDVADRSAPRVIRELDFSGSLLAARKIGDAVHSVVYDAPIADKLAALSIPPPLASSCYDLSDDLDAVAASYGALLEQQAGALRALSTNGGPTIRDGEKAIEPAFSASNMPGGDFLSVVSFGLAQPEVAAASLMGKPGFVYASSNSLYVAVRRAQSGSSAWYDGWEAEPTASEVFKFAVGASPGATRYEAAGLVKGTVLNQFSMDEWGGNLRIATTSGRTPNPNVHSTVTVLSQKGTSLVEEGRVDNIAKTEDIRSVRFDGDRGFLVTFKKTDPLFALDLSNPKVPRITGELKIPGFSTYMHFMDRTHILALGLEADDKGSYAYFNGIQLQIFDVADMAAPKLLHKTVIGTRGTTSDALTNHLGFNYFAPKNLLALPMTTCDGGGDGRSGHTMSFNGLLVYDVTVASGFQKRGGISHPVAPGVTCYNWWTNQNSTVKRSVIMDNYVYSVADAAIIAASLTDLSTPVATIPLQ